MEYYIVVNEWNYPTESGRELIGDFDTREAASKEAECQYKAEYDNFLDVTHGEIYQMACGKDVNHLGETIGYSLHSSSIEEEDFFFQSVIIKRYV